VTSVRVMRLLVDTRCPATRCIARLRCRDLVPHCLPLPPSPLARLGPRDVRACAGLSGSVVPEAVQHRLSITVDRLKARKHQIETMRRELTQVLCVPPPRPPPPPSSTTTTTTTTTTTSTTPASPVV
jgi:hypothetical protein